MRAREKTRTAKVAVRAATSSGERWKVGFKYFSAA
jgi:hypothetical protein